MDLNSSDIHKNMLGTRLDWAAYQQEMVVAMATVCSQKLDEFSNLVFQSYQKDATVFVAGNGGSAASATHVGEDFSKSSEPEAFSQNAKHKGIRCLSLTDHTSWITAISNDLGYQQIYVQQLRTLARAGDVFIALSGSGNSQNVVLATEYCRANGIKTVALTGYNGGRLSAITDLSLHVDYQDMGVSENVHLAMIHWVLDDVYAKIHQIGKFAP